MKTGSLIKSTLILFALTICAFATDIVIDTGDLIKDSISQTGWNLAGTTLSGTIGTSIITGTDGSTLLGSNLGGSVGSLVSSSIVTTDNVGLKITYKLSIGEDGSIIISWVANSGSSQKEGAVKSPAKVSKSPTGTSPSPTGGSGGSGGNAPRVTVIWYVIYLCPNGTVIVGDPTVVDDGAGSASNN